MSIRLVSDEKIAETSSLGNQEKWRENDTWYKLDQFGYEALAETLTSQLLERSNIEQTTPFSFVRYSMARMKVHGKERTGCASENFLQPGQALITLNKLLSSYAGVPLREKLKRLPGNKQRIAYLAQATAEATGLADFGAYLTLLFELDGLILNDDRHLNNIAVVEQNGRYRYCPIFDNGAALLSNMVVFRSDIAPQALLSTVQARPFDTTFRRQIRTAQSLYGAQLHLPRFSRDEICEMLKPLLAFYPVRDRDIIAGRVCTCVLVQQKKMFD